MTNTEREVLREKIRMLMLMVVETYCLDQDDCNEKWMVRGSNYQSLVIESL